MAFLEPCLFGKPVLGRNLPDITGDFTAQGVDFGHLYERLLVPESLIDMVQLRQHLQSAMERTYVAYGRTLPADAVSRALESMGDGRGRIDFGRLDEPLQELVIAQVAASPQLRSELLPASLFPASAGSTAERESIRRSREAVQAHYGSEAYGQKLAALYRQVADSRREPLRYAQPELLLDKFLAPERFSLLRAAGGTGR